MVFILQYSESTQHSEVLLGCAEQIILLNPDLGNICDRNMSKLLVISCYKGGAVITDILFLCQGDGVLFLNL